MALSGVDVQTQPCDEVHMGAVEFFNDGRWGQICGPSGQRQGASTVDANVVCRQLGFPFGSLMDPDESRFVAIEKPNANPVTWATEVICTGLEERIADCFFPEAFGASGGSVSNGLPPAVAGECRDFGTLTALAVICRTFPLEGMLIEPLRMWSHCVRVPVYWLVLDQSIIACLHIHSGL